MARRKKRLVSMQESFIGRGRTRRVIGYRVKVGKRVVSKHKTKSAANKRYSSEIKRGRRMGYKY